jgi:hypothetical protein
LHLIKTQHYSSILFAAVVKVHTHKTCKRQRAEREKEEEAARAEEETCKRQRAEGGREEEAARAEEETTKRQRAEREREEEAARAEEETTKRQRAEREREEEAARAEGGRQALGHQKAALERQVAQMQQQLEHHTLPPTLDPVLSHRSPN